MNWNWLIFDLSSDNSAFSDDRRHRGRRQSPDLYRYDSPEIHRYQRAGNRSPSHRRRASPRQPSPRYDDLYPTGYDRSPPRQERTLARRENPQPRRERTPPPRERTLQNREPATRNNANNPWKTKPQRNSPESDTEDERWYVCIKKYLTISIDKLLILQIKCSVKHFVYNSTSRIHNIVSLLVSGSFLLQWSS